MKRLVIFSYVAMVSVLAVATLLESVHGTPWAHRWVYGAWWFTALWALLALAGVVYILRSQCRRVSVLVLHGALVVILLGAFLSHFTGRSGTIHLRLDHPQDLVEITHCGETYIHRLRYDVTLRDFRIVSDSDGNPTDYCSEFTVNGTQGRVSMNRVFTYANLRFYQLGYDSDLQGVTLAVNRDPYGRPVTYCGYLLLFASLISLCVGRTPSLRMWLAGGALTAAWCLWYFVLDGSWASIPVLRSPLLFIHVVTIIMAYALLLVQTILSASRLIRRRTTLPTSAVPLLHLSLCFLAVGIFLGAVWADISWGAYWSWDSKEVWALITFMLYAVPAHRQSLPAFRHERVYDGYIVAAFAAVLMTYFGVNLLLPGLHSYT